MAIEAPLSKYKKNNIKIIIIVLVGVGAWFAYDGYFNDGFIEKHTVTTEDGEEKPNSTLVFNQKSPPFFFGAALLAGVYLFIIRNKKVVAAENALITSREEIPYDSIEKIDKTHFDSKGYFIITYKKDGDREETLKLNDRNYDNLPAVLDELVKQISG